MLIEDSRTKVKERLSAITKNEKVLTTINELPDLTIEAMVELERRKVFNETISRIT